MHNLKRIMFFVTESSIAKQLGGGVKMVVENDATALDVIAKADDMLRKKGTFPRPQIQVVAHGLQPKGG